MPVLLGNSGAPRWYQGAAERLDAYLANLQAWGATSTEVVLHHGPADERTARVHVLRDDWLPMIRRYRDAGIAVQFHASLDRRFDTARWLDDPDGLRREYHPILETVRDTATDQGRTVLVVHGASDPHWSPGDNEAATIGLLRYLADEVERDGADIVVGLELGAHKPWRPGAAARSRAGVRSIVDAVGSPRVGICWDLAHDCENASLEAGWTVVPPDDFISRVVHVHLHDLDEQGEAHYPPVLGRVPFPTQLAALATAGRLSSVTMEVRWRCAERLGDPWDLLGRSYREVGRVVKGVPCGR